MAGMNEMAEMNETLRSLASQARDLWGRFAEEIELERRMKEAPIATLAVAAGAGFVLGGGLWPAMRPFVRAATRAALSPANLIAIGAAFGALRASGALGEADAELSGEGGSRAH